MTRGYLLPANWIIHTVGPVWRGGGHKEEELLASCYKASLSLAEEDSSIRSLAFPCISTGIFGFPADRAAAIAIESSLCFSHLDITFCCFNKSDLQLYQERLQSA